MLKLKNLWETMEPKWIENEEDKSEIALLEKIREVIKQTGLPVSAEIDQVKDGLINKKTYDCITLTNLEFTNRISSLQLFIMKIKIELYSLGMARAKT